MAFITLDFETYYGGDLGFKKQTTEEYVRDPRFHVIGVGVKIDDGEPKWVAGPHDKIAEYLSCIDWNTSLLLCHNTLFDGCILHWIFGITPSFMLDTLSMARAVHGVDAGGSLAALAERYQIGVKGDEVVKAEGKRLEDFTPEELASYGQYCVNDVELTYSLFNILNQNFPEDELHLIDMTLRMFTHPKLGVDDAVLHERLTDVKAEKQELLAGLKDQLKCDDEEAVRKKLASNPQFAKVLLERGIDPPMKASKTTGKPTFAFAKTDEGFIALTEHEDPVIQQLCAVRLGTKSTLEENRIERFLGIGGRNRGLLPIPLKYYGAHTGRWSGQDKINMQNLPSRDKKKKALKNAIVPPPGYVVINSDSSQIEARMTAWLAGQDDVVEQFAKGEDVYSLFASEVYGRRITKENPTERFVGKTCILGLGYGTGATKLQDTLATAKPLSVKLEHEECQRIVKVYREKNSKIIDLWKEGDSVIEHLSSWPDGGKPFFYGMHDCVTIAKEGVLLPNGLWIRYNGLHWDTSEAKGQYIYKSRKGPVSLWGGSLVENVVQALARIVVAYQMLKIRQRYDIALTVHDAAVCVVPEAEKDAAVDYIVECMSEPPDWAAGLPVACEAKVGSTYGEC